MLSVGIGNTVAAGSLLIALPIAILAGLLSFISPCVLPLVPGYLAYVSGFAGGGEQQERRRVVLGAALFVLGFSVVFITINIASSILGLLALHWIDLISRVVGALVILMGIAFIGRIGLLQRTVKPRWVVATGLAGAPLLGIVFAIGWTPCIGPTLSVVLSLSLVAGSQWRAVLLGVAYCVGLGVPFLLVALGLSWATGSVRWLKRHIRTFNIIGGAVLILIGTLMLTGIWQALTSNILSVLPGSTSPIQERRLMSEPVSVSVAWTRFVGVEWLHLPTRRAVVL